MIMKYKGNKGNKTILKIRQSYQNKSSPFQSYASYWCGVYFNEPAIEAKVARVIPCIQSLPNKLDPKCEAEINRDEITSYLLCFD